MDQEYIEQLKRESENMWITDKFIESPCKILIIGYIVMIIISFIPILAGFFEIADGAS